MKWILILSMFVSCNALKTLTDGDTKVPTDFNDNTGNCNGGNCQDSLYFNLISFWNFDDANRGNDSNGQNQLLEPGVAYGTTASMRSVGLTCAMAQSSSDRFGSTGASASLNFGTSQDFTFAFWNYLPAAPGGNEYLLDLRTSSSTYLGVYITTGDLLTIQHSAGSTTLSTLVPHNTWEHYIVVFSRNTGIKVYKDGVLFESFSSVTNGYNFNTGQINLCGQYSTATDAQSYYTGMIDSVGIWNRALDATDAQKLYSGNILY